MYVHTRVQAQKKRLSHRGATLDQLDVHSTIAVAAPWLYVATVSSQCTHSADSASGFTCTHIICCLADTTRTTAKDRRGHDPIFLSSERKRLQSCKRQCIIITCTHIICCLADTTRTAVKDRCGHDSIFLSSERKHSHVTDIVLLSVLMLHSTDVLYTMNKTETPLIFFLS